MSDLQTLLKSYFERSTYKSIGDLAEAARTHAPISKSYISHMLRGIRENPAYDKLMAIAKALDLPPQETNRLLEAGGYPPQPGQHPQIERATAALERLSETPGISAEAIKTIVDGLVMMVEGVRAGLGVSSIPSQPPRPLMEMPLTQEEGLIDDLLGEMLAKETAHPLDSLFASLIEAANQGRWEAKRRIAESLPRLAQLQPDGAMQLAEILRGDYHPDYRADIRRRVIEAAPALYSYRPEAARALFAYRENDEVYTAMATVEALHDMNKAGLMSIADEDEYVQALRYPDPLQQEVVTFLRRMLKLVETDPDAALDELKATRTHQERIYRIAIQRVAPRLLEARPQAALELMTYFLRRDKAGQPVEHQNLRRPVSKALPEIFAALKIRPELESQVEAMLTLLAQDPDIHARRALGDALDRLARVSEKLSHRVLELVSQDQDPYIRQRAIRALLNLPSLGPEVDEALAAPSPGQGDNDE